MKPSPSLVVWAAMMTLIAGAGAFLPTKLNYSDPTINLLFCPSSMTSFPTDHKAITREALRREVRNFFMEEPPANVTNLFIPENASLTAIFRAYYGPKSSPTRFVKAVNSIAWANAMTETDGFTRYEAAFHMDGERINEAHYGLQNRYSEMYEAITVHESYSFARQLLGVSLNTIQDFYSQSTWLELGNTDILSGLGLPGYKIPEVAGPGDATCAPCSSDSGFCTGNVIAWGKLSSGYYDYEEPNAASQIVAKPPGAGKCSHGSSLDKSRMEPSIGGINKESTSPCFSPHHYLHQQAADTAITASESYIRTLRLAIGSQHFRSLLDLYGGSALSIIIDTTASMDAEIAAVKRETKLIVDKINPELYILVPYSDPKFGPSTVTRDSKEFLNAVNSLYAIGGGTCIEELFWHGLQLSLVDTPDYSFIYVFTDAGAKDAQLMEGLIALAQSKHVQVNIVYSFSNNVAPCNGFVVSGVPEYQKLADVTGGLFIEIDKFDIDQVISVIEGGAEETKASVRIRKSVNGTQYVQFPVDDSVSALEITISDIITTARLTDFNGVTYNLMDRASLESTENVVVRTYATDIKVVEFIKPVIGDWVLVVDSTTTYNLGIDVSSTLSFLAEFTELNLNPPRPSYKLIVGRPIAHKPYYVEVCLVGYVDSFVQNATSLEFITERGDTVFHVDYLDIVDDFFYILVKPLPRLRFFLKVDGYLESGKKYSRIYPSMVTPVMVLVELDLKTSVMGAMPGEAANAYFIVTNYGPTAVFDYEVYDEKNFITSISPKFSTIDYLGTFTVAVRYQVPSNALPGTVSIVTFTAGSRLDVENINFALTSIFVISPEKDIVPPSCIKTNEPNCAGFDSLEKCNGGTWSVSAILQDDKGLTRVYSNPGTNLLVDSFVVGTTSPVNATYVDSCCVTQVDIIGVDSMGNLGFCNYELNIGGGILEFVVESVGQTWINLRWTVLNVRKDLVKYAVLTDDDINVERICFDLNCYLNQTFFSPCTHHTFILTPYYLVGGVNEQGTKLLTDAQTLPSALGAPTDASTSYADNSTTTVDWRAPNSTACVDYYKYCYVMLGDTLKTCVNVTETRYTMIGLQPCTVYIVTITSFSFSGEYSSTLQHSSNTGDAAPGAPQDVVTETVNQTTAYVTWNDPIVNAQCVDRWMIIQLEPERESLGLPFVTDTGATFRGEAAGVVVVAEEKDHHVTLDPLKSCTNYTIIISAVSITGLPGAPVYTWAQTLETVPNRVKYLVINYINETSLTVVWSLFEVDNCFDHYLVCLTNAITFQQVCVNLTDNAWKFENLSPCTDYAVSVSVVSPGGLMSPAVSNTSTTLDVAPGPPRNVQVTDVTASSATITYDLPEENPACVRTVNIRQVELAPQKTHRHASQVQGPVSPLETQTQQITGLQGCAAYEVYISFKSVSGYQSSEETNSFQTISAMSSEPLALNATFVTTSIVILDWFSPKINPYCVTEYRVDWVPATGGGSKVVPVTGAPFNIRQEIGGLNACTSYKFSVTAFVPFPLPGGASPAAMLVTQTSC